MDKEELYITVDSETILIKGVDSKEVFYAIRLAELPLKRADNTSEWIIQIMDKLWLDGTILYKLAQIICKEFPENTIDWRKTFSIVEKAKYLENMGEILIEKADSTFGNLSNMIAFSVKEGSEETEEMIMKIVLLRLAEYKLI